MERFRFCFGRATQDFKNICSVLCLLKNVLKSMSFSVQRWENEFLKWDPADFCGINLVTVPRSMVWIPDIAIREDASDTGTKYESPNVNLFPDGWTYATFKQLITFTCQLNLSTFPFDDQICRLTFTSMNSDAQAIRLGTTNSGTQLTNASKHVIITQGEWELKNIEVKSNLSSMGTNATVSDLIYWVTVSRRPMLYVINFIIPLFFFLILDLGSFFINEARGEKLGFKVTILLSISVLLLILKDMLPSTEAKLPWIANYCLAIFALVGISVLEAMAVSFLLSFEVQVKRDPPPSKNCKADSQLQITNSKEPLVPAVSGELNPEPSPPSETPSNNESELLRRLLRELTATREEMRCSFSEVTRPRFRRVAQVIDTVFFLLYFITVVVFLGYMYTTWARGYFANLK